MEEVQGRRLPDKYQTWPSDTCVQSHYVPQISNHIEGRKTCGGGKEQGKEAFVLAYSGAEGCAEDDSTKD